MNTQARIVAAKNELKALKTAQELAWGALSTPDQAPSQSWSGSISLTVSPEPDTYVMHRWRARFTRSDGKTVTPFVQFAFSDSYTPTYKDFVISQGASVSGPDFDAANEYYIRGYTAGTGTDYVDYYIEVVNGFTVGYTSTTLSLSVQALSPVIGTLTLSKIR